MSRLLLLLLVLAFTPLAVAQSADEFDRILLPLTPERVSGAFGSEWVTDIALTNVSDTPVVVHGYAPADCFIPCPTDRPVPPRATIFIYATAPASQRKGATLRVERGRARDLALTLRVRDRSRANATWGTVVPVARPVDLRADRFGLSDIPIGSGFRATLRVYDVDARTPARARLRVYAVDVLRDFPRTPDPDPLLLEREIVFTTPSSETDRLFFPSYAEVALHQEAALAQASRVRVEIEPLTGEREYWAFVSITHNETQHVTVLSP